MHLLWTLIIGLIIGAVAKLLMPGKDPGGFIITMLLGIAGSVVATYLGQALGLYRDGSSAGFIASVLGAMLLLFIYRLSRVEALPLRASGDCRRAGPLHFFGLTCRSRTCSHDNTLEEESNVQGTRVGWNP
jgi:uncharacterized membrane protein YeaQ/YmgE (transglycosylase-associated protein family)